MVRFEEDKLVIVVDSGSKSSAVENWIDLQAALIGLLSAVDRDLISVEDMRCVSNFILRLSLCWDDAKKMIS